MKGPKEIYVDVLAVVNDCSTKISTKPLENFTKYIRSDLVGFNENEKQMLVSILDCLETARKLNEDKFLPANTPYNEEIEFIKKLI